MTFPPSSLALLTAAQMRAVDAHAIASGMPGIALMERAGSKVAEVIHARYLSGHALVLCGGGNNGGDGFVIARCLKENHWRVTLCLLAGEAQVTGDARTMLERWKTAGGECAAFSPELTKHASVIVDALFGTGLSRAPEGMIAQAIAAANASGKPIVAVDVPSGVNADTGEAPGIAINAALTVTFCRAKLGLLLLPGRTHAGELMLADIGISEEAVEAQQPNTWLNDPVLWHHVLPRPTELMHKYARGHAVVLGGPLARTGAARLSALAATSALRIGAGLVTVACPREALSVYAETLLAVMTAPIDGAQDYANVITDPRITALTLGPGAGVNEHTRAYVEAALARTLPTVLDADALSVFEDAPAALFSQLHPACVLTPHEGEFARLFLQEGDKITRARSAAAQAGCVVLLKGADTVIAAPDGRVAVNANAPPWLATAGSGDVLAGLITGLLAQGMSAFDAACAGAWMHADAAARLGPGLIADDLPQALMPVLAELYAA